MGQGDIRRSAGRGSQANGVLIGYMGALGRHRALGDVHRVMVRRVFRGNCSSDGCNVTVIDEPDLHRSLPTAVCEVKLPILKADGPDGQCPCPEQL